jgi:tRNA dimethylallyltransferase
MSQQSHKKLHVIVGPTASGKTDYSISLAQKLSSPIISCDSRQIYKELKIGTAPPSIEQLSLIKHYFIFSHSIHDYYTAGRYEVEALSLINKLFNEYDNLVMVGGSGLYVEAVCKGLDNFPQCDISIRDGLTNRLRIEGIESLRRDLKVLDIESYNDIDISNPQRIIRALEVTISTGKKFSSYKNYISKKRGFEIVPIFLNPDRDILYNRINRRVDKMIEIGLIEEVNSLRDYQSLPSLKSVGYRELFEYFNGEVSLEKAIDNIKINSRRYAKRQVTWFKNRSL